MRLVKFFLLPLLLYALSALHAASFKELEKDLSDSVITAKITAKFTGNTQVNPFKIMVNTKNGIVTLSGTVPDADAYFTALKLVRETRGVKYVDTEDLEIKDVNSVFVDAYITTKVQTAILRAKLFDDDSIPLVGINTSTSNGIVTLTGEVKSQKALMALLERVSHVRGVKQVISHITITNARPADAEHE